MHYGAGEARGRGSGAAGVGVEGLVLGGGGELRTGHSVGRGASGRVSRDAERAREDLPRIAETGLSERMWRSRAWCVSTVGRGWGSTLSCTPMNPGHAVRNGKFYFFSPDRIEVVRPWGAKAGGWIFTPEQGWKGFVPHFHLDYMRARVAEAKKNPQWAYMGHEARAFEFLLGEWPEDAQRQARKFPEEHWRILQFVNRLGAAAVGTLEEHAGIGFLLAMGGRFPGVDRGLADKRAVLRLLGAKRREIVERFGFPSTESAARVLDKIPPGSLTRVRLFFVRRTLRGKSAGRKALLHLPRLNGGVIGVVTDERLFSRVTFDFLSEVSMNPMDERVGRTAFRLTKVLEAVPGERAPLFRSLGQLNGMYDELQAAARVERPLVKPKDDLAYVFPPPPVAPCDGIEAITTPADLAAEGAEMHHCARSYIEDVAIGRAYVYRMLWPERATIRIERAGRRGPWIPVEVQGRENKTIAPESHAVIEAWLSGCGQSRNMEAM